MCSINRFILFNIIFIGCFAFNLFLTRIKYKYVVCSEKMERRTEKKKELKSYETETCREVKGEIRE